MGNDCNILFEVEKQTFVEIDNSSFFNKCAGDL